MLIKDRFESNLQEIKALEELLNESNSKLKAYNVEAEPLNKKLQELYVKYDCRKINENLREIPKKIEALKKEHYFYFTESILKFMLKLEEHDKYPYFDVDDFLTMKNIDITCDVEQALEDRKNWTFDSDYSVSYDSDDWDDAYSICDFNGERSIDELQEIANELMLFFNAKRILKIISTKILKGMPFKELKNVLEKYDLHIQDKSYKSSIKPVEKDGRIYVFDSEGKNLFDYPDSADVDILIFKLEEDLDNLKQKLEEDPDYIEYQRLKEKFGS